MKTEDLKIGIIGYGQRKELAHKANNPDKGSEIVAVADIDNEAINNFHKKFGKSCFSTNDHRKLLDRKDIDAIIICSPDYLHEKHAIDALKAGKAVYLEKPMAITIKGCDKILTIAKKTRSKLFLGHNMRYMGFVHKLKEIIDSGTIGEIKTAWVRHFINYGGDAYYKDWHANRKYSTGLLLQKGAHDIDIIHWLCNSYSKKVTAMGSLSVYNHCPKRTTEKKGDAAWHDKNWPPLSQKELNPVVNVEDNNLMLMELENGTLCSYQQCHYTPDAWRNYTFIGTKGRIENFNDYSGSTTIKVWNKREKYNEDGDIQYKIEPTGEDHGGSDDIIMKDFINFVNGNSTPNVSPIDARNSVAAGYQATMSLRKGSKPMNIPKLSPSIEKYFKNNQK